MPFPTGYKEYLLRHWPEPMVEKLLSGLDGKPSISIRLNTARLPKGMVPEGADGQVPWCPEGFYLKERPLFTADPLFHAGAYYVQEASSMFLAHVLRSLNIPTSNTSVALDLCAAPGGKSTLLRSLLPDDCMLICNEPIRQRAQVLAENMAKWGHPNVIVTQENADEIAHFCHTHLSALNLQLLTILADVPCSGEGMFRKEPEAVAQWSPDIVAECAALQRSIITDIWPALQPGGHLIYSTCTFNPEEDEDNVDWICRELGAELVPITTPQEWHILHDLRKEASPLNAQPYHHFLPGTTRGEGFFMAVLRKHEEGGEMESDKQKKKEKREKKKEKGKGHKSKQPPTLRDAISEALTVLPTDPLDEPDAPSIELTADEAIRYLQRESLILPPDAPRGHIQVCHQGQRLGLMNNLGTRANNLYPKEWRIRSGHITPHNLFSFD